MPYTSHGWPYGTVDPSEPIPRLVAKCGGPGLCSICRAEAADPIDAALAVLGAAHYSAWLDQITPTLVALGWTPPPAPAEPTTEQAQVARMLADPNSILDWDLVQNRIGDTPGIDYSTAVRLISTAQITASWPERAEDGA